MSTPATLLADTVCRRTLDLLTMPVLVWTPEGGVIHVNRSWSELTGRTREDSTGDGWLRSVHDDDRPAVIASLSAGGGTADGEPVGGAASGPSAFRVTTRDGRRVRVEHGRRTWTGPGDDTALGVLHTLTPCADDEARTKAMSRWAHELRGPLNAILGWSDLLSAGDAAPEVLQRGLRSIANNARQQAAIIKRMVD